MDASDRSDRRNGSGGRDVVRIDPEILADLSKLVVTARVNAVERCRPARTQLRRRAEAVGHGVRRLKVRFVGAYVRRLRKPLRDIWRIADLAAIGTDKRRDARNHGDLELLTVEDVLIQAEVIEDFEVEDSASPAYHRVVLFVQDVSKAKAGSDIVLIFAGRCLNPKRADKVGVGGAVREVPTDPEIQGQSIRRAELWMMFHRTCVDWTGGA